MARLPGVIDVGTARGARPSGETVRPTDFALGELAGAVEDVGQAIAVRDDRAAEKRLEAARAQYETDLGERAAGYDGREPGFANEETSHFETYFKTVVDDPELSSGQRFALTKRLDKYRAQAADQARNIEGSRRAGVMAEQRAEVKAQNLNLGVASFQQLYGEAARELQDSYDGSTLDFTTRIGQAADDAMTLAMETVPEDDREAFQTRALGLKAQLMNQAGAYEANKHQAYLVDKVKTAQATTVNMVIGNPDAYGLAFATAGEVLAAGVPKSLRGPALREYQAELVAARVQGLILKGDLATAGAELKSGRYDAILEPRQKVALTEAVRTKSAQLAADLIQGMKRGEPVEAEAREAAKNSGDRGLQGTVEWEATVGRYEADALASPGGSKKGFVEAATFVIDELEGGEGNIRNDNGRGLSRFGINQAANPDVNVSTLTRAGAVNRYRRYWAEVGADKLPPGLAIAAFDAAVLMGGEKSRRFMAESGYDVGRFLALEQAEMHRLAKADPAKYGDDLKGWLNRVEKVRAEAGRRQAFANVQEGLASDPIKFALRVPTVQVPALPGETSGPAFQAALQGRLQVGDYMAREYRAPLRMLTDAEATRYRDIIGRNPQAALDFAEEALAAVGPQAARALMGELGKQGDASLMVHLGDLAAGGSKDFARTVVSGLGLKASGTTLAPEDQTELKAQVAIVDAALEGLPAVAGLVRQSAEAAMIADQGKYPATYYVQGALGAKMRDGRVFGGMTVVNGRRTVLPPWLAQDYADDAMDRLAAGWAGKSGPRHGDGKFFTEKEARDSRLVMLANGNYALQDSKGKSALGATGKRFELDLDASRESLRNALGPKAVF